jgi:hypothetical protein
LTGSGGKGLETGGTDAILGHVTDIADYDALREIANQLAGLLVARQRGAPTLAEARRWREEHRKIRLALDQIQPGTSAVTQARRQWAARIAELRTAGA